MGNDQSKKRSKGSLSSRKGIHFEALEPRILFDASAGGAPTAEVSVSTGELTANEDQLLNDNIEFNLTFDNNGGQEGYVPYIDFLALPEMVIENVTGFGSDLENPSGAGTEPIGVIAASGELLDINSGLPINHPMYETSIGSPSSNFIGGAGSGTEPVTYDASLAGYYLYSVELPFGSYTPGNPPAEITVEASLNDADGIIPSTQYDLVARGAFALGCDALDNPGTVAVPDDEPVFGGFATATTIPQVVSLAKSAGVAEGESQFIGENASGPNHPVTYRLEIDVAEGETVDNLRVTDILPDDLAYLGNLNVTGTGGSFSIISQPLVATDDINGVPAAQNTLELNFAAVTGGAGTDIVITYDTFIPYIEEGGDLVIDETTGQEGDLDEYNDARVTGDWTDNNNVTRTVSDNAGALISGIDPDGAISERETDYQIDEHSLAIQKGVGFAPGGGDRAASGWSEGDIAEFTMNFQISDYFAFGTLEVTDTMGDGLEFLPALDPGTTWLNGADFDTDALEIRPVLNFTMHVNGVQEDVTVDFDEANFSATENVDGTTTIIFDVYQQLVDSAFITAGDALTGGMIPTAGLGADAMGSFNSNIATVGSISYRAKVRNEYATALGNTEINQGDTLTNNVVIEGENLNVDDLTTTSVNVSDGSGTTIDIVTGTVTKELFSATRNGDQRLAADLDGGLEVVPGDVITWRIVYELPITEFEGLSITDYLPLPVFDANEIDLTQVYDYDPTGYLTGGRVSFGPSDSFIGEDGTDTTGDGGIDDDPVYATPNAPTLSLDAPNNAFTVSFGDYDIPESEDPVATTIELFVSTTITDGLYAEGLRFTNQVGTTESNSFNSTVASNEIAQINLGVPDLTITKGVLAVGGTSGGSFDGSRGPSNILFNPPASTEAFDTTSGDPITSDALDDDPNTAAVDDEALIDANFENADAGDVVTFGITVQNRGNADFGAFDVQISDTLPAGFDQPTTLAELNLRVTDGNGATIDFDVLDNFGTVVANSVGGVITPAGLNTEADVVDAFFNGSIELVDPGDNTGALAEYDGASGQNLALIAYDLVIAESAVAGSDLINTATVENFSYRNGGPNYAEPEDTDTATVQIERPNVVKQIVSTSHVAASNEESGGGRTDDNRPEVAIGEVVTYTVAIDIPEGTLTNVTIQDLIQPGMAFVGVDSIAFDSALTTSKGVGDFTDVEVYYNASSSQLQLGVGGSAGLGTIVNTDTDNSSREQVTFTYKAVVLNDAVNQSGVVRSNDAEIRWAGEVEDDSASVRVVEPNISVSKSLRNTPSNVEGADTVTYRIVVRNNDSGGNTSEGYDVELSDFLPDDVTFISATYVNGANGLAPDVAIAYNTGANTGSNGLLTAAWDTFDVGSIARFDVVVSVNDALDTDTVITNTAEVEFTSLPDDPGDAGYTGYDPATDSGTFATPPVGSLDDAVERTGDPADQGGAVNDYNRNNSASVTVINPVGIDKVVIETSEDHTAEETTAAGDVEVAIGEVVRYEVRIRVPQATSSDLELVDVLGAGLEWIPAASNDIQFRLEGFNPDGSTISASSFTAPELTAALAGSTDFPAGNVSFNGASNTVTFDFGDIINTETDSAEEFIYISYNAIVQNKDPNDLVDPGVTRGATLTNTVQLREGGVNIGAPLTQEVTVVEPDLTITKSDNGTTTADAGDVIDYTLTITAATSIPQLHTTAFDLLISDVLPDQLDLVASSVQFVGLPGTSAGNIVENTVADSFTATVDRLEPGETFQITFQGTVRDTGANIIESDETVTNTASLVYSTLPGDGTDATTNGGTVGNETGSESGTPGDTDGERITNRSNSDSFTSPAPVLSKVLANPADTTFTIGEPVEYVITLQVPEGEVGDPEAYIIDTIDPGFRFIPGTLTVTPSAGISVDVTGVLDETNANFFTFTDPGNTAQAEELRFDFDRILFNEAAAADGLANGTIEIRYQLQVENILANQQGDTLNNEADFFYTDENGTTRRTVQDSTGDSDTIITIVEPQVDASKTITTLPNPAQAGETVEYRVTLTNPGGAGNPLQNVTAFEVTAQDTVPAGLTFDQSSFSAFIGSTEITGAFSLAADGWTLPVGADIDLAPGEQIVITYDATIDVENRDGEVLTNVVDVDWTSLDNTAADGIDVADTGERGGFSDLDTDNPGGDPNDYEDTATADMPVNLTPVFDFEKRIIDTSVSDTGTAGGTDAGITDLVIGETVTYELVATLPRGTVDNVRIIDQLALANGLLDITNVQISAGSALTLPGGAALTTVSPSVIDSATADGYDDRVVFSFGTVINTPPVTPVAGDDQIVITITALVVNDIANQQGDVITNTGQLRFLDDDNGNGTRTEQVLEDTVDVEIIEPQVTTNKRITAVLPSLEAGVVVPYEVTLTNDGDTASPTQPATAYEVSARDTLPADLILQTASFTAVLNPSSDNTDISGLFNVSATGWEIQAGADIDLAPGDVIQVNYNTIIAVTVNDQDLLTNEVDAEWTSIDGTDANERGGDGDLDTESDPLNDYESGDEVTIRTDFNPTITKTVISSSENGSVTADGTDPAVEDLVIGEGVTYEILVTLGRGTTENVRIFDQLEIDEGLLEIATAQVTYGAALSPQGGGSFPLSASISDSLGGTDGYFDTVDLVLGNVVNSASGPESSAEQIRILVTAAVLNVEENQQGDVIDNNVDLFYTADPDADGTRTLESIRATASVEIVEPQVDAVKTTTSVPSPAEAGETISYQVTLTNPGGPGNLEQNVTAYEVTAQDVLPAGLELVPGTFEALLGAVDITASFSTGDAGWELLPAANIDLAPGEVITITYDAVILDTVRDGDDLTNEVDIEWTSVDGAGTTGPRGERGGDGDLDTTSGPGNPNDYEDNDTATVQANLTPVFEFEKRVLSTSATHTDETGGTDVNIEDLVVGETVTYELVATMGRGTTDGVRIVDQLSIANGLLDITNVSISGGAALSLPSGTIGAITPTVTDSLGSDTYRDRVEFNIGTVTNDPALVTDAASEQIRILITAVVVNDIENQGGDVIANTGTFFFQDDPDGDGTRTEQSIVSTANVEIVEPVVNTAKTITSLPLNPTAGERVEYQVVLSNPAPSGSENIVAFDVTSRDDLPDNLSMDVSTFEARVNGVLLANTLFDLTTDGWSIATPSGIDLNQGENLVITYEAVIQPGVQDGENLLNEVDTEWTSLDGTVLGERSGNGDLDSETPAGQPNDYESGDTADFDAEFTSAFAFDKSIVSTSESTGVAGGTDSGITDLVVGETVTYALTATVGRGTTDGVRIVDQLAIDNGILDIINVQINPGSALSLDSGNPFSSITPAITDSLGSDTYRDRIEIDFGTVVNDASATVAADEQIQILVTARVVNIAANTAGDVIENTADFFYFDDPDGNGIQTEQNLRDRENVEILEPSLSITKAVNNDQPRLNEILTYTLTVTNNPGVSATDAFDLVIDDLMDSRMTLDVNSVNLVNNGTPANPSSIVSNTSTANNLVLNIDRLDEGESIEITYEVRVSSDIADFNAVLPNDVELFYSSIEGDDPNERGGDPDTNNPDDPDTYTDDDNESVEVFQPDLRIQKLDYDAEIVPGGLVTYEMTVTNQGRAEARTVTVTDDISHYLEAGFQFLTGTNATLTNGVVTFTLPDMPIGDVQVVTMTLQAPDVIPAGLESITNIAVANHEDIDPTPPDNEDPEETPVIATPDLVVTKDDGLLLALTGDEITYVIEFTNVGDQVASGVIIEDILPPGMEFISATNGGTLRGGSVFWEFDSLAPGEVRTVEVIAEVITPGFKLNTVTIKDDGRGGPDPTPENNRDIDTTDTERRFRYDLTQDFRTRDGNQTLHEHHWGSDRILRREPVILATYMASGLAQAGSTITLEVYDERGQLIADTSVVADAGGNWLASFPMADVEKQPARIEMKQTWASYNPAGERSYNFRTYFGPAFSTGTYYTEQLTVHSVMEKRNPTDVIDLYESSKMILAMDWNGQLYEFAARGALQSSSGN